MSGPDPAPDAGTARRGRPGHDREAVLRRAVEMFNRRGYDATSIGDLAGDLGVTKSAIYHHVPSKEHLLDAALREALDSLESALDEVEAERGTTAHHRLRHAVRASVVVLVDHLPAVTLLLRVHGNSQVELDALRRRRGIDDRLAAMVRAAVEEGSLRDDIPAGLVSRLVFGMVNSLVEWVRPGGGHAGDELADAVTELVFTGLAASSAPAPHVPGSASTSPRTRS